MNVEMTIIVFSTGPRTANAAKPGATTTQVKSKIGSTDNIKHKPAGGNVKILDEKKEFKGVHSKVGSMDYAAHKPGMQRIHTGLKSFVKLSSVKFRRCCCKIDEGVSESKIFSYFSFLRFLRPPFLVCSNL